MTTFTDKVETVPTGVFLGGGRKPPKVWAKLD